MHKRSQHNCFEQPGIGRKREAKQAGEDAEIRAKAFLIGEGLQFVEQNFKVPMGELDLIFKQNEQWVFVEVKYRQSNEYGCAAEQFTPSKRHKMVKAIMCYLQEYGLNLHHTDLRIDVIAIDNDKLDWLINV